MMISLDHQEALLRYCKASRRDPSTVEFVNNGDAIAERGGLILAIHEWSPYGKLVYRSVKRSFQCIHNEFKEAA